MNKFSKTLAGAALTVATTLVAAPTATVSAAPPSGPSPAGASAYTPHDGDAKQNARLKKIVDDAVAKQKASGKQLKAGQRQVVYYDDSDAGSFKAEIDRSAQIWNEATNNVDLKPAQGGERATLQYHEGNYSQGSYAMTDQPGTGEVFIDFSQTQEYDKQRVVAHETGHILGLPDNYQGPCSELMSGGGPGPSCTNSIPNAQEAAQVDSIFGAGGWVVHPKGESNTLKPAA